MSRRHDQSYKLLFSLPLAIEHMIRGFVDDRLADELDFARAESLATERSTPSLVRSQADMMWKIHFRGSARPAALDRPGQRLRPHRAGSRVARRAPASTAAPGA